MKKILYIIIPVLVFLTSCNKDEIQGDFQYVRHKGADMPVWVRGNTESDVFIIYIHGGPGGSTFIDIKNNFLADIESRFAMVYYDQRSSGNCIGKSDKSLITIEQFMEDLDVIVDFINTQYSPEHIVLFGHSWGGTLGTAFLLEPEYRNKISAWIEVDGGHNMGQNAYEYSRDYVIEVADSMITISEGKTKDQWQEIKDYYNDIESWRDPEVVIDHSGYVTTAGGYFYDPAKREGLVGIKEVLTTETDFTALLAQNKFVIMNMDVWYLDYTDRLDEIDIPTLVLWGRTDGILPVQLAYEAKESMNLPEENFYVFEKSGHSPHYEETALFNQKVIEFIERDVLR